MSVIYWQNLAQFCLQVTLRSLILKFPSNFCIPPIFSFSISSVLFTDKINSIVYWAFTHLLWRHPLPSALDLTTLDRHSMNEDIETIEPGPRAAYWYLLNQTTPEVPFDSTEVRKVLVAQPYPTLCNPMDCSQQAPLPVELPGKNTGVGCYFFL